MTISTVCGGAALAQTAQGAAAASATTGPSGAVSEVIVTGSRIVRDGYTAPTPVTVATVAELEKGTPTNLPDALNKLPQFANSVGPKANPQLQANSAEHGNVLNLRGVGGNRVLVLLDGIRVPPTTYRGAVDSNVIPQLLVQRVDVVTAGASAAYGSDAVSGVVNYVLDKNFTGWKAVAQYGISNENDLGNYRLGIAGGHAFLDGRARLIFSAERNEGKGILRGARPYGDGRYAAVGSVVGSTAAPGTTANPFTFISGGGSTIETFGGLIVGGTAPGLAGNEFLPGGTIRPLVRGQRTGTSNVDVGGDGFYIGGSNTLVAPLTTNQGYARFSFALTDNLTAFAQANYARAKTRYQTQANFILGSRIFSGNAFLQPSVQALMGPNDSFTMFEYFEDFGPFPTKEITDAWMTTVGLDGKLGGSWAWNAQYTHGSATTDMAQRQWEGGKLHAALDAVRGPSGAIVCRVTLTNPGLYPGCVPLNPFGRGAPSQAAVDWISGFSRYHARNETDDLELTVNGDLFELPAGPVSIAAGVQYREQKLRLVSNSNPAVPVDFTGLRGQPATTLPYIATNVGFAAGSLNVKEAFGEIAIPVLRDMAFARSLDLNAAGRITDYSTSGRVETWKVGAVWKPVEDLTLRVTRSRDIRAPTLFDLFAGRQVTSGTLADPHTGSVNPVRVFTGGNAALKPEIADTFTVGAVVQPSGLPGFTVSLDFYDLRINGAITLQSTLDIVNECEASNGTSPSCALIVRPLPFSDRSPANFPLTVDAINQNISFIKTRGVDVDASYHTDLGPGALTLRLYANWVDQFLVQTNSISPVFDYAGYGANGQVNARPKFKATLSANYALGDWGFFVQESMIGKIKHGPTQVYAEPPLKRVFYTDVTLTRKFGGDGGSAEAFLTVNNLFDKQPPLAPNPGVPGLYYPTLWTIYDVVGRTYTAGLRLRF